MQNLNQVPISAQPVQGGAQKLYKTTHDLRDIQCYICDEMSHYASVHQDSEAQQLRALEALFPRDDS